MDLWNGPLRFLVDHHDARPAGQTCAPLNCSQLQVNWKGADPPLDITSFHPLESSCFGLFPLMTTFGGSVKKEPPTQ